MELKGKAEKEYTIVIAYQMIDDTDPKKPKIKGYTLVKFDWTISPEKKSLTALSLKEIKLTIKYEALTFSWRHLFLFIVENKKLKFLSFQDAKPENAIFYIAWSPQFVESWLKFKPLMYAVEHGNVTKVLILIGTYL